MGQRTPFYHLHVDAQAKIVDFAGWDMPLHYGSQIEEHHHVRKNAGVFDVSHMGIVDVQGQDAEAFLRALLANDVARLVPGKALYSCMLNEKACVLDDVIVYKIDSHFYRVVINAGRRAEDFAWLQQHAKAFQVTLKLRDDLAMLAIQGPKVQEKFSQLFAGHIWSAVKNLKPFHFHFAPDEVFIARTGYTGEEGYELIFPADKAEFFWKNLLAIDIKPCGLGARDTLRLEAGLNLYGSDMDESVTPLESNLSWTVVFEPATRDFIGRKNLENQKQRGVEKALVGLILQGPGIIRNHQKVSFADGAEGEVTSGGYSPTLEKSIALARIPRLARENYAECYVEIRNKKVLAKIVKPPFVRFGKVCV